MSVAATPAPAYQRQHVTARCAGWLADGLPRCLVDDPTGDFAFARFVGCLEQMYESVLRQIDSLEYLLDTRVTPTALLPWLAGWIGVDLGAWELSEEASRRLLIAFQQGLSRRGTIRRLEEVLEAATGGPASVDDGLQVYPLDGAPDERPTLLVRVASTGEMRPEQLAERLVELIPAGVRWELKVGTV